MNLNAGKVTYQLDAKWSREWSNKNGCEYWYSDNTSPVAKRSAKEIQTKIILNSPRTRGTQSAVMIDQKEKKNSVQRQNNSHASDKKMILSQQPKYIDWAKRITFFLAAFPTEETSKNGGVIFLRSHQFIPRFLHLWLMYINASFFSSV